MAKKQTAPVEEPKTVTLDAYNQLLEAAQKLEKENMKLKSALSAISNLLSVIQ